MSGFLLRCHSGSVEFESLGTGRGLSTLVLRHGADALVVHGDRLVEESPPEHAPLDELLAWTARSHARYCAVLVRSGRATLWSDIGATCPLHYARAADDTLLIATSAGAMLPLLPSPPVLGSAEQALLPGGRFAGVTAIPANSAVTLVVDAYGTEPVSLRRLQRLPDKPEMTDPQNAVDTVREALRTSVARLASGLDEVGVMLSGGVDSSTVAALAARETSGADLRTYTVGTPFGDEFEQAAWFAERLGSKHQELLFGPDQLAELLPGMIRAMETWDLLTLQIAAPACFLLNRTTTGGRQVLLSGYGADLVFAGLGGSGGEEDIERAVVAQTAATSRSNEFSPAFADARDTVVRYPYWSRDVMAAALGIRGRLKARGGTAKWVLRSAAAEVLPEEVAWRPKRGIHEGTAMSRMFAAALGSDDRRTQAERLQAIAASVFCDGGPAARGAGTKTGTNDREGSDEGLAGVAS
ncbi:MULTISPECIES: asparagine synthase C-terminal domain-containing protein [unclassified Streptomyces]|uniref:asparagine synthase C-terminal domain-containing protein n=1 Tax=unclassified Streptomyces TaxID=2593676 RepID=UPI00340C62E0